MQKKSIRLMFSHGGGAGYSRIWMLSDARREVDKHLRFEAWDGRLICSKCVHVCRLQLCLPVCNSLDCNPSGSCLWDSPGILEWVAMASSRDLPYPGIEPTSLGLLYWQACCLPLAPLGSPLCSEYIQWQF